MPEQTEEVVTRLVARPMDFYQCLRARIKDWLLGKVGRHYKYAEYLLSAPDFFHLLIKLVGDKRVPDAEKAKVIATIVYFVSPIDIIPEVLFGVAGFIDDLVLAAYVLNSIISKAGKEVVREHWAGDGDVILLVEKILAKADELVGSGVLRRIRQNLKK